MFSAVGRLVRERRGNRCTRTQQQHPRDDATLSEQPASARCISADMHGAETLTHTLLQQRQAEHTLSFSLSHTHLMHISRAVVSAVVWMRKAAGIFFFFFFFNYHADTFNNCVNSLQKAPQFVENNTKLDSTLKKKKEAVQIVTRFVLRI